MNIADLSRAKVLIIGGGVTGSSVADILQGLGSEIAIFDENDLLFADARFVSAEVVRDSLWDLAVVSPGWKPTHPVITSLLERGVPIMSEVDLAWHVKCEKNPSQRWIAVTGTNGKTTTVELTTAMLRAGDLRAAACGNVGNTVIAAILGEVEYEYLVLELSSFQLYWSQLPQFQAAAILNIADDHVDWHETFDNYVDAKMKILDRTTFGVLNADDLNVVTASQRWQGKKIFYTLGSPKQGELGVVEDLLIDRAFVVDPNEAEVLAESSEVHPLSPHNVSNVLAASALARIAGISHLQIRSAIASFRPGRHRIELVGQKDGIRWINDSKATNPHAAIASLKSVDSAIWIAGGLAKGASMHELVVQSAGRIRAAILIGQDRELIANEIANYAPDIEIVRVDQDPRGEHTLMEMVVIEAKRLAQTGDTVLMAPACASMDQFVSYADRGDQFARAVEKIVLA